MDARFRGHDGSMPMSPYGILPSMVAKALTETMERAASWPAQAQEELAGYAEEIEAGLRGGVYRATDAELAGIDRGLAAARQGRFATQDAVEAVFAKHRPA
jgi:predicted transcriptional regulator